MKVLLFLAAVYSLIITQCHLRKTSFADRPEKPVQALTAEDTKDTSNVQPQYTGLPGKEKVKMVSYSSVSVAAPSMTTR